MENKSLPPLPPSDNESLQINKYDGFYKVRARDFWKDAVTEKIELKPEMKCDHDFKYMQGGVTCKKCHFGLLGMLEVQSGKLFHQGKPIEL